MNRHLIVILIGFFFAFSGAAQATFDYNITEKNLRDHVQFLSSEALEGRLTGTTGEKLATDYIAALFQQLGLEPAGDNGTFFQAFRFTPGITRGVKSKIQHGRNVLAKLRLSQRSTQIIVIGAHVDHLGRGQWSGSLARDNERGMIHSGADDNASGVASVLAVAAQLQTMKTQGLLHGQKDILFAIWSGEEYGILGSSHFVNMLMKNSTAKSLHPMIDAAINLDMVGHLREKLVLQGAGSSADWREVIQAIQHTLPLITQSDPYLPTDSTAFYLRGVPTLNLFTGAHENYHTPRDKPETLNYDGIKHISEFLLDLVLAIEDRPSAIAYREVQKNHDTAERGFKIYLGTIPDYAGEDVRGVKLSGVAKNSPADQVGIQQGDVIVKLAGKKIRDIYDYTSVLNKLPIGKPVPLVVVRDKINVALTVVARYRV